MVNALVKILLGLEIHITLNSQKKIFNWENNYRGNVPINSCVGPWEMGYLGVLPILNPEVIELGIKLAVALSMNIDHFVVFQRKIYNYPDLSKGYQDTQEKKPLAVDGFLPVVKNDVLIKIPIQSIHLEEDTAKATYCSEQTNLDFNRAGNPLIELVTKPFFNDVDTVLIFIKQLQNLLVYLDISESKMEKGQLRIDLNYSLQIGETYHTSRYEIKNLNSLANIEKTLQCEIEKHCELSRLCKEPPDSWTVGFDERKQNTVFHRQKTSYFFVPEFNIPTIRIRERDIRLVAKSIPTLPWELWQKARENNAKNSNHLVVQPFLAKIIEFLTRKNHTVEKIPEWIIFSLNYLPLHFGNLLYLSFAKKNKLYLKLFQLWSDKQIGNNEIKTTVEGILNNDKNLVGLRKVNKKNFVVQFSLVEKELNKFWGEELSKKMLVNQQKVQNYLLGKLKEKFPQWPVIEMLSSIKLFLEKKQS